MLRRDLRAGELNALGLALVLAVTALSAVGFLSDRVGQALALESRQLLGGDLLLSADHPWPDGWREEARSRGIEVAESATFPSMANSSGNSQLMEVKAVSANYPLRGALRIAPGLNQADAAVRAVPALGTVWLDERGTAALGLAGGQSLRLGTRELQVAAVLTLEPERGFNFLAFAPRLLMNRADLASTALLQAGSRVTWKLHLAGDEQAIEGYRRWAEGRLGRGEKLESLDNARPEVRAVLERAERFLRLAALLSVVLAAVAMGLAADRYMRRHLDACAVLRCLGAGSRDVLLIHGGEFLAFGLLATLLGCLLGQGLQLALQQSMAGLIGERLPAAGWLPWLQSALVGLTLVVGFVLPPLLRLRAVPALRVLRREWAGDEPLSLAAWIFGAALLALLMRWMAGEWKLWAIVLGGFAAAIAIYALAAFAVLRLARRWRGAGRWGVANLNRHLRNSLVQAVALGLGLTALLLLTVGRDDLMAAWRSRVPPDAPNRFVINIQPEQRAPLGEWFAAAGLPPPLPEPMVRGRLATINGKPVKADDYPEERARRLVEREFNLSWSAALPAGNSVVSGEWYGAGAPAQFSVEQGLAETLGLKVGDLLAWDIAGRRIVAPITSLRKLDWDSMRVNFFVVAPPGVIENFPASYIFSFRLEPAQAELVPALVRRFPNLTLIDVDSMLRQVQDTMDQVARAVQSLFAVALLCGLVVLYAALQASSDERQREIAVMRALGARQRQLRDMLLAEYGVLGVVCGLLAGLGASAIAAALAHFAFQLPYTLSLRPLVAGIGGGLLIALSAGWLAARAVLRVSPLEALREA
jgi:putative ABC transport system permease protein